MTHRNVTKVRTTDLGGAGERTLATMALAVVCGSGGCANYATLQDPETVPAKEFQLGVGGTFNRYALEVETTTTDGAGVETTSTSRESFTVPALTLSGRYGVSERFELHGIAWLPFGASLGGKYMLTGDRTRSGFAFSPGTVGIAIGAEAQVMLEGGALYDTLYQSPILSGAVGFAFM
jgi:hypothetical protein